MKFDNELKLDSLQIAFRFPMKKSWLIVGKCFKYECITKLFERALEPHE
jgi:hypothetical protein